MSTYEKQLIQQVQSGDNSAFAPLLALYNPLISKKTNAFLKQFSSYNLNFEEVKQEASIGFWNAIKNYDETKNPSFYNFANLCIGNILISFIKKIYQQHKREEVFDLSIDPQIREIINLITPSNVFAARELEIAVKGFLESLLTKEQLEVWNLRVAGFSQIEIAEKLNMNKKKVDNITQSIYKKLRANKHIYREIV